MIKRLNKDFAFEVEILPNEKKIFDFQNDKNTDDYTPFKNIQVLNTGTEDIKIFLNNQRGYKLIPKGTIYDREDKKIYFVMLENTSTTNTAKITMTLDNDYSQKELLKALVLGKEELEK